VAALLDVDAVLAGELGAHQRERLGRGRERSERVQVRGGVGDLLEARDVAVQLLDQLLVERLLARERAFPGRQRLVLERLQLRRDEALGVLHRLPALVLHRHLVELPLRDLDEEPVHAVELDAQVGDAGALALALLHLHQERAAIALDRAQLVELRVATVADHAAFAQHRRGSSLMVARGALQIRSRAQGLRRGFQPGLPAPASSACSAGGSRACRAGPRGRAAAPCAAPRAPVMRSTSDQPAKSSAMRGWRSADEGGRGRRSRPGGARGRPCRAAGGAASAQAPAAHGGGAAVEERQQRRRFRAGDGLRDLEVAARRRVHQHELAFALHAQPGHVRQRRLLRVAAVAEERAGGAERRVHALAAVAREVGRAELAREVAFAPRSRRTATARGAWRPRRPGRDLDVARLQQLRGLQALDLGFEPRARHLADREAAARERDPRDSRGIAREFTAASRLSREAASSAESVTVPGVTMRMTRRSTGPFDVAGSPTCSQIAADSPRFTSFAR
jgi:hypothetical protein